MEMTDQTPKNYTPMQEWERNAALMLNAMLDAKRLMRDCNTDSGSMPCPRCKTGILYYRREGRKQPNRSRGRCSTDGCIQWIE